MKKKKKAKKERKKHNNRISRRSLKDKRSDQTKVTPTSSTDSDLYYLSDISSEAEGLMENISKSESTHPVSEVSEGLLRRRKSTSCAKVLVRAGLRCNCHFIYVSRCPFVEFAPMPKPQ